MIFLIFAQNNIDMKKVMLIILALVLSVTAFAQTAEEIVAKMDEVMEAKGVDGQNMRMTMDIKIPILGTMSTNAYVLGDKMRMEATMMGQNIITWQDGQTEWEYDAKENTITIKNQDQTKTPTEKENMELFSSATDGYDVSISKETADAWYLKCKKNKSNTNKDDPKTMDLVIAKGSYMPLSLSAKIKGVTVTIRNLGFDVTEKQVTFNKADYPTATFIDKR
jgi:outer membrane lipoprotein-sorting protein